MTKWVTWYVICGVVIGVLLFLWTPSSSEDDTANTAAWLALARQQRIRIAAAEDSASKDSASAVNAVGRYRLARATRDSLLTVLRSWEAPRHSTDDTVQFSFVRRLPDTTAFRVPTFLVSRIAVLEAGARDDSAAVEDIVRRYQSLDAQRVRTIGLYRLAVFSRDSVISKRDERIAVLTKRSWRDYTALAVGMDAYGKPNMLIGVRVWPRSTARSRAPLAPLGPYPSELDTRASVTLRGAMTPP